MFVFYEERGKTAQQRELYRKRASAPGKDIMVSGKEEGTQPRIHVRAPVEHYKSRNQDEHTYHEV